MEELTDLELIQKFNLGDELAFEQLYYRYRKPLYGFLNHLIQSNMAEVDEVFEITWLKVIDHLHGYHEKGKFSAWLFRIARNVFFDRFRQRQLRVFMDIDDENMPKVPAESHLEPNHQLDSADLAEIITNAVDELPTDQREVFLLRQQDLAFKEIAEIQKCTINTALSRMQYALKGLRAKLSKIDRGILRSQPKGI